MQHLVIKLYDKKFNIDYYMEWSTILDAPYTFGCTLQEFKKYYKKQYGIAGLREFDRAFPRIEATGCSSMTGIDTVNSLILCNRAGKNERKLTMEQILHNFCRNWNDLH